MIKHSKQIQLFLLISLSSLIIFFGLPVKAAEGDGCCELTKIANEKVKQFIPTNADGCKGDDYYTPLFHPNQVVSGQSCIDKPKPVLQTNSSLPKLTAPDLKVSIPFATSLVDVTCTADSCTIPWLAQYIAGLQKYAIGIIGIIAVIVIMIGGIVWLTSAGNSNQVSNAKKWITGGLSGLVLVFGSYLLLYTINPNLTVLKSLVVQRVDKIDLDEMVIDPVIIEESKTSGQKIPLGKYCGCVSWRDTKSTTTLNSAEAINAALKNLSPRQEKSPLEGMGNIILEASNTYGIDPAIYLTNAKQDSDMGTSGRGKTNTNAGNITCPMTAICKNFSSGCNDGFLTFSSWENSIKGAFCYYKNSDNMKNAKTIRQMISTYAPPCIKDGNCSNDTKNYIDYAVSIYAQYNKTAVNDDSSEGKSCDCFNPCDRCAQAGTQCCEFKKK
jgi:hypothetical protein